MMSRTTKWNFCSSSFLYNNLQSYKDKVLVLDTRDADSYAIHNISNSINISFDQMDYFVKEKGDMTHIDEVSLTHLTEMMSRQEQDKFGRRKRCYCILIVSEEIFPEEFRSKVKQLSKADDFVDYFEVHQKLIAEDVNKLSEEIDDKKAFKAGWKIFNLLIEDRVRELYVMFDGADRFFDQYPFMDPWFHPSPHSFVRSNSLIHTSLDITYNLPNDIWGGRLFLGTYNQASQYAIVQSLSITHVVNVTAECTNAHEAKGIKYLHIVILDEKDVNVLKYFKDAYDFIDSALSENDTNNVLLHCALGKSRSATITIMFLMKKFGFSVEKALDYVKMRRRIVDPNYGFIHQLEEFEKCKCGFEEKIKTS